jgi:predicted tellurium resistance membrane protein TerC
MYFVLEAARGALLKLDKAVMAILLFIAVKLVLGLRIDPFWSLAFVLAALTAGVVLSLRSAPAVSGTAE